MSEAADSSSTVTARAEALATRFSGAALAGPWGPGVAFDPLAASAVADGFACPLPDHGRLTVEGDEAAKFLHAQLTNDVEGLGGAEARWYGYCTPKGRMLASFLGWREPGGISLVLSAPLAEPVRKRLSMFVLRARARVLDRSAQTVLFGVGGAAAAATLGALGLEPPPPMALARADGIACIGLPEITVDGRACPRWLLSVDDGRADAAWRVLRERLAAAATGTWRWTEVRSGVPRIVGSTVELFVPQMVNFELVGGVSFRKGCYPGQEVVARSHYLGKLKRRTYIGHLDGDASPAPGDDVHPAGGGDPCGQVVLAAPSPSGGIDLLFECQIAALEDGPPRVAGRPIEVGALPYAFPA